MIYETSRTLSGFSTIRKTEFVKMLADPDEVDKITPFDRDYLFLIAAASISMNNINFEVTCKKGHLVSGAFNMGEVEPVRLRAGESRTICQKGSSATIICLLNYQLKMR